MFFDFNLISSFESINSFSTFNNLTLTNKPSSNTWNLYKKAKWSLSINNSIINGVLHVYLKRYAE